jgi:hypothetical protein
MRRQRFQLRAVRPMPDQQFACRLFLGLIHSAGLAQSRVRQKVLRNCR